jgi:hypothetical protein
MNTTEFIKGSSSPYYKQFMKIMDERNLNVLTEKIGCSVFGGVESMMGKFIHQYLTT